MTFVVLPAPEDLHAIQRGLCEVMRLSANHQIDHKHAAVLLRGLAICSANLARIARQQRSTPAVTEMVHDYVHDPVLGTLAIGPEPASNAPLPNYLPVLTPKPTITYTPPTPEEAARIAASYAKVEAEFTANVIARPRVSQLANTRLDTIPVQTYPTANEDFGPKEKIISMPHLAPAPALRVPHLRDSLTIAKVGT